MDAFQRPATFCGLPKRGLVLLLINALFWQPIWAQAAPGIVASNAATQVTQAGNGVPVVNIAAPNASGLSHNQYQAYNVGKEGVILNNATGHLQATQLGGIIVGNAKLQGRAASTILNEVNGGSPSQLNGYTEVAGGSARVIVANPYGITCNGCGFINTPRATLTTGKPVLAAGGQLQRFEVNGGQVSVEGQGLDASNIDEFEIITRSAKINGEIHARKLAVIAGRNDVAADTLDVTSRASDGNAPELAIDASALGGMYANTIRLVGTEAGVGVKLDGKLAASAGDMQLDANGHLSVAQAAASGNIDARGRSVELAGPTYAGGKLTVQADTSLSNLGTLAAAGDVGLTAGGTLRNRGIVEAGVNPDNSRNQRADVNLRGSRIENQGQVVASRSLDASASGTLDNQAGLLSGRQGVTLAGRHLDNRKSGTIASREGDLTATFTGTLDNRGQGAVVAQGKVQASAARLENSNGVLSSGAALNLDVSSALLNASLGLIDAGTTLTLSASGFDNRGGQIQAQGPATLTLSGDSQNAGGSLYSAGTLHIDNQGAAFNSQGGSLTSAGSLTLLAASFDNSQAGTTASAGLLRLLVGGTLTNTGNGLLYSQAAGVDLHAEHFDNSGGITQGQTLTLAGNSASNDGGSLVAHGGAAQLMLGAYDNGTGTLVAKGLLEVIGDSFANQGRVAAGSLTTALTGTLDNRQGVIETSQTLAANAAALDNRNGSVRALGSSGSTELNLRGLLDNQAGSLESANRDFTLSAASLSNAAGQITHAGDGQLGVALQLLDNAGGALSTRGALDLRGDSWTNSTAILASALTVDVASLTQTASGKLLGIEGFTGQGSNWLNDGEIATDGNLALTLGGAYSGVGQADAGGSLSLTAAGANLGSNATLRAGTDSQLNVAGTFASAGRVTSNGALSLRANALHNQGTLGSAANLEVWVDTLLNDHGLVFSGQAMNLHARTLTNRYGDLYTFGAMQVDGADGKSRAERLENISGTLESGAGMLLKATSVTNRKNVFSNVDQLTGGRISVTCYDCSGDHHNVDYVASETFTSKVVEDSPAATLQSGGNLIVEASTLANHYSTIASNADISISAENVVNQAAASSTTQRTRIWNTGRVTDGTDERFRAAYVYPYNSQALPKELPLSALNSWSRVSDITTVTDTGIAAPAVIQAAGKVHLNASQNISNLVEHKASDAGASQVADTSVNGVAQPLVVQLNAQLPADLAQQQVNPTALPGFSLPIGQGGLFRLSDPTLASSAGAVTPASNPAIAHRYLIETNPALTDMRQFMSSDYLLGLLGYNPDSSWKRLGDGFYEQRLVQQAITARTGQALLDGQASNEAQFKYLMDNALASKQALHLSVGVALSAEQVAALTHDIVWMQDQVVRGEHVLVPVLYLANANARLAPTGALVQGSDVSLISGQDLVNSGTLRATGNLAVQAAGAITNTRLMQAGERLDLTAGLDVNNRAGGILSGRDVSVTAISGNIINERSVSSTANSGKGFSQRTSVIDSAARIEAGNDLAMTAGNSIVNVGGVIQAGGDASLSAANDVLIAAAEQSNASSRQDKRHSISRSETLQHGSEVSAGNNLSIGAGNDLNVIASQLKAGNDMALQAGNDLSVISAANDSSFAYRYKGHGKKIEQREEHSRQVASIAQAGGSIRLIAGNNVNLAASRISAGGEAYLYAGNQLNLLAAQNTSYSLYDKSSKGSWGSKKTRRDEVTDVTYVGSQIQAGGNISLGSGSDQTYQAARLVAGRDLSIDSGGAITFAAVKDLHQESHEKSSKSLVWTSMSGKGRTDETVRQTEMAVQGELMIQAAQRISVDVREVNQQSVHQTIDAMVDVNPDLAWLKDAEARGDVDWRRVKEVHDSYKYSHSGLGGAAQLVIAIIIAYFTAGAASGLVAGAAGATGATTTAGAAWASSATMVSTTTVGATTVTATTTVAAGWANAAMTAVLVGMETNAAIGLINNGGNLGAALRQATSKDALKSYAIAGATAGLTSGLYDEWTSTETGPSTTQGATQTTVQNSGGNSTALLNSGPVQPLSPLSTWSGVGQFAANQALQNSTSALLSKALGQKGSLGDALQQSLVNTFMAAGFNLVGDIGNEHHLDDGGAAKIGLHALMGGLAAEAMGGDFSTGALAAGVNEALVKSLSETYAAMKPADKQRLLVMNSQLIGVLSASLQGSDEQNVQVAAAVNASATQYNWLLHGEIEEADRARKACEAQGGDIAACKANVTRAIDALDRARALDQKNYARSIQLQALSDGGWAEQDHRKAVLDEYFAAKQIDPADVTYDGYAPAKELGFIASEMGIGLKRAAVRWPGETLDTISQIAQDPSGTVQGIWAGLLGGAGDAYEWATSEIPAQGIDQAVDESQANGPQGMGEFVFDAATGILAAELGGVAVKWVSGRWVAQGGSGGAAVGEGFGGQKTIENPVLDAEKAALDRIGQNPKGPDLTGKQSGSVLQAQSQRRIGELAVQYNTKSIEPKDFEMSLGGKLLKTDPAVSKGAPVYFGATPADVMSYFKQLAGIDNMPVPKVIPGKGELYTAMSEAGAKITLRGFSRSSQQTGASWTIDVIDKSINGGRRVEIKFK